MRPRPRAGGGGGVGRLWEGGGAADGSWTQWSQTDAATKSCRCASTHIHTRARSHKHAHTCRKTKDQSTKSEINALSLVTTRTVGKSSSLCTYTHPNAVNFGT